MNAPDLLDAARHEGVEFRIVDGGVQVAGDDTLANRWLKRLRPHRAELMAWLRAESLIRAAMRACDYWSDGAAAREQMVRDCLDTPPEERGALQAHFERAYPPRAEPRGLPAPDTSGGNQE